MIQLKNATGRTPWRPKSSWDTPNVVVPAAGPATDTRPAMSHVRLPNTMASSACHQFRPIVTSSEP